MRSTARNLVVVALLAGLVVSACSGAEPDVDAPGSSASESTNSTTSATASPSPSDDATSSPSASGDPDDTTSSGTASPRTDVGSEVLAPVSPGTPSEFGVGVVATVTGIADVQIEALGPGDISGPGKAVAVSLANLTSTPLNASGLSVTAYSGDGEPLSPSESAPSNPLSGEVRPGATAEGTYVFRAPAAGQSLRIELSSNESSRVIVVVQ